MNSGLDHYRVAQKGSHYQIIKNRINACQWDRFISQI